MDPYCSFGICPHRQKVGAADIPTQHKKQEFNWTPRQLMKFFNKRIYLAVNYFAADFPPQCLLFVSFNHAGISLCYYNGGFFNQTCTKRTMNNTGFLVKDF